MKCILPVYVFFLLIQMTINISCVEYEQAWYYAAYPLRFTARCKRTRIWTSDIARASRDSRTEIKTSGWIDRPSVRHDMRRACIPQRRSTLMAKQRRIAAACIAPTPIHDNMRRSAICCKRDTAWANARSRSWSPISRLIDFRARNGALRRRIICIRVSFPCFRSLTRPFNRVVILPEEERCLENFPFVGKKFANYNELITKKKSANLYIY